MILYVFSVYDVASAAFGRPVFLTARGAAVRAFSDQINSGSREDIVSTHPEDFQLYELGVFDDSTGIFDLKSRPDRVVNGADLRVQAPLLPNAVS